MNLNERAQFCEKAENQCAEKIQIHRDDEFYLFKCRKN